jgi:RHS repeat-associated protein
LFTSRAELPRRLTPGSEVKYWPYGGTRAGGVAQTDKLYTGQQREDGDAALGLYNYKARFYSTVLGRFVSADPLGGRGNDPATQNAYAYARNNPLRWIDPTGECNPGIDCPGDVFRNNVETWCNARPQDCGGSSSVPSSFARPTSSAPSLPSTDQILSWCAVRPQDCGGGGAGGAALMPVALGVGVGISLVDGPLPFADAVAVVGVGVVVCVVYCPDAGHALSEGISQGVEGIKTLFGSKKQPGELGIGGATRGPAGTIKLKDGTYLKKIPSSTGSGQSHHGETHEQYDYDNQRYRGVEVNGGRVIPKTGWKPAKVPK